MREMKLGRGSYHLPRPKPQHQEEYAVNVLAYLVGEVAVAMLGFAIVVALLVYPVALIVRGIRGD